MGHQKNKPKSTSVPKTKDSISGVSEDREVKIATQNNISSLTLRSEFAGPIPHPKLMAEYKQVDSTFPDRILKMAEEDLKTTHRMQFLGWLSVYSLSVILIIAGVVLLVMDKPITGFVTLAISAIFPIIQLFFFKNS